MKAGVYFGPHDIEVEDVADPKIIKPTDAIVRITYTCICGSDLWSYRGISPSQKGKRTGHELMGIVEEIGSEVRTIKKGALAIAPFAWCDGTCPACKDGMSSYCWNGGLWGTQDTGGGQAQKVRVPFADASLFVVPKEQQKEKLMPALLTLSDVMCTGHHAAVCAGVGKGAVVAVVGDGAVGLCAVLAAKRLGAKRIILLSHHPKRTEVGTLFGATDIVQSRGEEAIEEVKKITGDVGVDCALECVGTKESWKTVLGIVRIGGRIGFVGVPHDVPDLSINMLFRRNVGVMGGIAPAASYIPELLPDILSGKLDPSPVFDMEIPLGDLQKGYEAMDKREAIKVLVRP